MRASMVYLGMLVIVIGILVCAALYPVLGYRSASGTVRVLEGTHVMDGIEGVDVKIHGVIDTVISGEDPIFNMSGYWIVYLEDLSIGGVRIAVISDHNGLHDGDGVSVTGVAYGAGKSWFIAGEASPMQFEFPAAEINRTPHDSFYAGFVVIGLGLVLLLVGVSMMPKRG